MSAFRHSATAEFALSDISKLPPRERAKRYRELAKEARVHAAHAKGDEQAAFIKFAGKWELLAREVDDEAEAED